MPKVERRRHPRVPTDLALQLTFKDTLVETRIHDLSSSGIRFRAPAALPLLSRVQIALQLPDAEGTGDAITVAISGVVVRCAETEAGDSPPYDTAIFFEDLSEPARRQISRFVTARL
ncbi:MAG: PilZ domain-containing protein [Planctomycetota bacterium]|jgi:c-di-GMP-binding flagellar brake protein YcgR